MRFVIPTVDLRVHRPVSSATRLLTKALCEQHAMVPITLTSRGLVVAMVEPENRAALVAELEKRTGFAVEVVRANADEIEETLRTCYGAGD